MSLYLAAYNYTSKERTQIFFPFNQWQNWQHKLFMQFFLDVKFLFTIILVTTCEISLFFFYIFFTWMYICDSFFTYLLYLRVLLIPTNVYYSKFQSSLPLLIFNTCEKMNWVCIKDSSKGKKFETSSAYVN